MRRTGRRRARRTTVAALGAAGVLALTACGASPEAAEPRRAVSAFTERTALPSCGGISLGQGEGVPDDAWSCVDEAGPAGAELAVTSPTTEGDPVTVYYRVGPGIDGLELFHDATQDQFGSRTWHHELCPRTVTARDPLGCRDV